MSQILIGKTDGRNIGFDIPELLVSRLLVQANSGGGKSYLLRRILEQAYGKVQAIVIDPAGEFSTLREKYGYVLVGEHGETPADVRSAALVAEKLLELRASAVCDLYALKPAVRHTWLKHFLTAVMNSPKRLWHPVLFVVDEAHKFAPEKGEGESEAKEMMLSLASDGRKYGFCGIFATQRLAKLDKSLASELLNVLIGPTFMDIDLQRAHKALGIVPKEQAAFNEQMKTIRPGNFWALGRAISKHRVLVKVGDVETTHPQAGSGKYSAEPPPAPDKVKAMLPKLADLPKQAEEKARTEAEFKREIRELKQKLTAASRAPAASAQPVIKTPAPDPARLQRQIDAQVQRGLKQRDGEWNTAVRLYQRDLSDKLKETAAMLAKLVTFHFLPPAALPAPPQPIEEKEKPGPRTVQNVRTVQPVQSAPKPHREPVVLAPGEVPPPLGVLASKIAGILAAYYPKSMKRTVLAAMCGVVDGGNFSNRLSEVRMAGLLVDAGRGLVQGTELCARQYAGSFEPPTTTEEVLALWEPKLGELASKILRELVAARGPVARSELAERCGVVDGGNFSNRLSELRVAGLLLDPQRGMVAANPDTLFLDEVAA